MSDLTRETHVAPLEIRAQAAAARAAAARLSAASDAQRQAAVRAMADAVRARALEIVRANAADLERLTDRSPAFRDRLALTPARVERLADALEIIAALPDPLWQVVDAADRPNGMQIRRVRVPIGVIAMIYESRPSVTVDAAGLCVRSGNVAVLRGGTESLRSDMTLVEAMHAGLRAAHLPVEAVTAVSRRDYEAIKELVGLAGVVDLVIPRGGPELIRFVDAHARVPVLRHEKGVTHVFIDRDADVEMGVRIVVNAKTNRPSTCNALEKVLVDAPIASRALGPLVAALRAVGVEVRGCPLTRAQVPEVVAAGPDDWSAEYLDLVLAVRVVDGLDAALEHIRAYGSGLADAIVTGDRARAERFVREVDSAAVLVNASTRLVDGGEFGLGAEVGISTNRLHARGPMGLVDLTTTKWVVWGSGQIRE